MRLALAGLLLLSLTTTTPMPRKPDDPLKSRAELTNYEETSRYADVIRFINELQKRSGALRVEAFGQSEEGRALPLLIFADLPVAQPREARAAGKPVIFIMANIHAGEVEGKEAMLHLARRIATGDLQPLLDKLIILIAPIYNADGNERITPENRVQQYGPIGGVGTRENAKGLDLNRDYMKLDSPEARALVSLFNRWDPHLTVDLHTTNGSYHGYHLTYSPTLNPNADARLIAYERERMLPAISKAVLARHKYRTYFYGNFATQEAPNRELLRFREGAPPAGEKKETKVWRTFDHRPRFGNNYAGLRHRLTILSEAYSYLDFRGRVGVTAAFVEEILKYSAAHADEIVRLIKRVDEDTVRRGLGGKLGQLGVEFEMRPLPKPVEILLGAVEKKKNPRSGREMTAMIEDKFTPARMLDYGLFAATKTAPVPRAYLLRAEKGLRPVIDKLLAHGLAVEELTEPMTAEVESFVVERIGRARAPFQGHREVKLLGRAQTDTITFPAGTILVRTAQPLAPLAFYLLEAQSDDGLVTWNFFDDCLEAGKTYPVHKLMKETKVASRLLQ
jgi:hypothetical protein